MVSSNRDASACLVYVHFRVPWPLDLSSSCATLHSTSPAPKGLQAYSDMTGGWPRGSAGDVGAVLGLVGGTARLCQIEMRAATSFRRRKRGTAQAHTTPASGRLPFLPAETSNAHENFTQAQMEVFFVEKCPRQQKGVLRASWFGGQGEYVRGRPRCRLRISHLRGQCTHDAEEKRFENPTTLVTHSKT